MIEGRRPRTWVKITRAGKTALRQEVQALRDLLDTLDTTADKEEARR